MPRRPSPRRRRISWLPWLVFAGSILLTYWALRPSGPSGIRGIDVSHYQGKIDWKKVKRSGVEFAFIKASEGKSLKDDKFKQNWKAARKARVLRGAYHFFRPSVDAEKQATFFLKQFKMQEGDLPPVLDLEVTDGQSAATIRAGALKWMQIVERKTGVRPVLYTMPRFARDYLDDDFADYPLWLAHLRSRPPRSPKNWQKWSFWQYSHSGRVRGIRGKVDLNVFSGSKAALLLLAKR
ncbi:MAG: glycoside hydrolase family 25 protein [Bacteroidota bacterium]